MGSLVVFLIGLDLVSSEMYIFTTMLMTVVSILIFVFFTRLPTGWWGFRVGYEIACFLLSAGIFLFGTLWGQLFNQDFPDVIDPIQFFVLLGTFSHIAVRIFARPYTVWMALLHRRLVWEITHAQLRLVVWTMVILCGLLIIFTLANTNYANYPASMTLSNTIGLTVSLMGAFGILTGVMVTIIMPPASIIAYLTARRITQRIEQLARVTHEVRNGDESVRVVVTGIDEIAHLQADFNMMMEQMQSTRRELERERDTIQTLLTTRQRLFADVSHELRTPIAIIRGHLDSPSDQTDMAIIRQEVLRLQTLVDDAFVFARADIQQLPYHIQPLEAGGILEQVTHTMKKQAWQSRKVDVILDYQPQLPLVMGDAERLKQVLYNLLRNAIRHTPPGGLIRVTALARQADVQFAIHDTGEGISAENLPMVWDRFHRSGESDGAGLGLALVKEMVGAMGGQVAVESAIGKGSCFSFTLPHAR
jgi:signal transduction histidine kinase